MESFFGIKNFKKVMVSFSRIKNFKSRKKVTESFFSIKNFKSRKTVVEFSFSGHASVSFHMMYKFPETTFSLSVLTEFLCL